MPWFPEFYSAAELARRDIRAASLADPVGQYLTALANGDTHLLDKAWPGHVIVFDPRAGEIRGHRELRRFIRRNQLWLAERGARPETIGTTRVAGRAVVELLVQLDRDDADRDHADRDHAEADGATGDGAIGNGAIGNGAIGNGAIGNGAIGNGAIGNGAIGNGAIGSVGTGDGATGDGVKTGWPVAVVAVSDDTKSVQFRTYCSQWAVDGRRHLRPPILTSGDVQLDGVVGRLHDAYTAGDADAAVRSFSPDGYLRESTGPESLHRGSAELRSFFTRAFSAGGGIELQDRAVTDDGVRCAVEYNCTRWGSHPLPPQAGLMIHERGADGLLAAVRMYDDVEPPIGLH